MPIYKSRPKLITAYQYDGDLTGSNGKYYVPDWVTQAFERDYLTFKNENELYIRGRLCDLHVRVGDYLVLCKNNLITKVDKESFEQKFVFLQDEDLENNPLWDIREEPID